jgi:ATP-dependent Clp protease ATP-binding subunit ClpC
MHSEIALPVFQRRDQGQLRWHVLSPLPALQLAWAGTSVAKMQRKLTEKVREIVATLPTADLPLLEHARGIRLERIALDCTVRGETGRTRVGGRFPFVFEPRWLEQDRRAIVAYHPLRSTEWVLFGEDDDPAEAISRYLRHAWQGLTVVEADRLRADRHDQLRLIALSVRLPTLRDKHEKAKNDAPKRQGQVLAGLGTHETQRAIDGTIGGGTPREPARRQLAQLYAKHRGQSAVVVGPPQVGKSTVIRRLVADLIEIDEFPIHRNLDRTRQVWRIEGKRLIAGMSHRGDWEERCLDLLAECKRRRAILWIEDLHLFGRLGRSRGSDRSFADFFRGPIARGELIVIGECTREQLSRLEDDAPSFAALFTRVALGPTSGAETRQLLMCALRELEIAHRKTFHPYLLRAVVELGSSLFPWTAMPGAALSLLRQLPEIAEGETIDVDDLIALASQKTGMPRALLTLDEPFDVAAIGEGFEARVIGQPDGVACAKGLVCRIRAGLTDPRRPDAVLLFTGPTGTGKTELARAIASCLYGDESRLLRFDMSEYSTPDAVARLIGDRWHPRGLLTQRIREQPFSVVLLDEIEKAHRSVLYLLLQLFDEARLTDAEGETASFHHAVIIMTSNLGARPTRPLGFGAASEAVADVDRAVRAFFPPELFNRIDEVVAFRPLDEEVATSIATKELQRLLGRRGLRERSAYVYANEAVKRRVVAEAFDARQGARTVKRYLEDSIGSLLADHLSRSARAQMQVIRLYEGEEGFRLHVEPLIEAEPEERTSPLEPWLDRSRADLALQIAPMRRRLDQIARRDHPGGLDAIARKVRKADAPELSYWLDAYRARLDELRELFAVGGYDRERLEAQLFSHERHATGRGRDHTVMRQRRFDRREAAARGAPPPKNDLVEAFAEVLLFERAGERFADLEEHRVVLGLQRLEHGKGATSGRDLLAQLVEAYADPAELEGAALGYADGRHQLARDAEALAEALARRPTVAFLRLTRLFARSIYAGEAGSHIWRSLSREPDVVRIDVFDGSLDPQARLKAHRAGVEAFERALEVGGDLPPNPAALAPAVRSLAFDPPLGTFEIEIEDLRLSHHARLNVRNLREGLRRLWFLHASLAREGAS